MFHNTLDLMRATEAAAIAASQWVGTGDKLSADKAATDAMRDRLNRIEFAAKIMIGEGKKDASSGLFNGDAVGKFAGQKGVPHYEIAVDPIDGTRPTVTSGPEALSVLALAEENALFATEEFYMHKIAYGPDIANKIELNLNDPIERNTQLISAVTGKAYSKIVVCILDRPRHEKIIAEFRKLGVRIKLIQDCDVSGAIATCLPDSGIDLLYGIGGAPEGVISACAMKCLGGGFKGQLVKGDGSVVDAKIYSINDLVRGHCVFAATGITNGSLLKGVRYTSRGPVTHSVVMRSESGTVRWVSTYHGN
ncbi:MAG TPA: fructose-bisphosphatase class II family protein [Verrucomicrobiae bacterium]|jgi:fructose-1,6-bisphosphatase II|nr:fructose-bisphosphatase class II family protein [Verrucomicrobiae bacterium]